MESKFMELKVMYCNDLKAFNFFQKLLVYVLVSLVSEDPDKKLKRNQQQRTPTDTEDDGNPAWNHEMRFDLSEVSFVDCDHLFLHFDLLHEGLYFGNKTIGDVRVPLKDLIQESSGITRFVNYQVRSPEGKPNGILNFSYKVNAQGKDMGIHFPTSEITGYSVVVHHHHESSDIQNPAESSSPVVHYPPPKPEDSSQETYPPAAEVSYPIQGTQQQSPYPPTPYAYYPPPPPPFSHGPPPPPPFLHGPPPPSGGAHHHPSHPSGFRPWAHYEVYDYSAHGSWSPNAGHSQSFGHGEIRRHDYRAYWNGR